ncbi:MAG TPA: hypothetical protein VFO36_03420, partial [Nitrospiraceae bacterium]|nr:hypothetical protein [Nitrospiraceae bacterium]
MHPLTKRLIPILLLAGLPFGAFGQSSCKAPSADCIAVGELDVSVSLGLGKRTNPISGNSDIPLVVVPHVSYYGKRFFLENFEVGYTLYE